MVCSVRVPSIPIWWHHPRFRSHCCATMLCRSGELWKSSVFIHLIHSGALLQAALQTNTEPFRNGLVESRNRTVEMRIAQGTLSVHVQIWSKWRAVRSLEICQPEIMNSIILILSTLMNFINISQLWKIFGCFCLYYFLLSRRGNKLFEVHFGRIRSLHFPSKDGKYAGSCGQNGWKGVYFLPESTIFLHSCYILSSSPYLYLDLSFKQLCFSPRKRYK